MRKLHRLRSLVRLYKHAHVLLPALVVVCCLAVTYQLWSHFNRQAEVSAARVFERSIDNTALQFQQQLRLHASKLESLKALFIASESVNQSEFDDFVATLRLQDQSPSVRALGFIKYMPAPDLGRGTDSAPITFIGPRNPENLALLGFDTFSNPQRRAALLKSRDENRHVMTEPVHLIQDLQSSQQFENLPYAYIMFLPVYAGSGGNNQCGRSNDLAGWVYLAFRFEDLLNEVLQQYPANAVFRVYDRQSGTRNLLVYQSHQDSNPIVEVPFDLNVSRTVNMNGRGWEIHSIAASTSLMEDSNTQAKAVIITGLVISSLIGGIVGLLSWRNRALRKIRSLHRALLTTEQRWKYALEGSGDGVWDYSPVTGKKYVSKKWKELLGFAEHEMTAAVDEWKERIHPEDYPHVMNVLNDYISGKSDKYTVRHRVKCKDGSWKWILSRGRAFAWDEEGRPTRMVGTITDLSPMKATEDLIWHQANFDALTGVANRRYFFERLENEIKLAARLGHHFAVLFIDLDEFKTINDQYGHQIGDEVLIRVTHRIRECIRETDTIARLGGDEFTVILGNLADPQRAENIIEKILDALREPIETEVGTIRLSASIGASFYPQTAQSLDDILNLADKAMCRAKLSGKDGWQKAEPNM